MSECDRLQDLTDIEKMSDPGLLQHAETCPVCRVQIRMNGLLRDLTLRMPRSNLSPGFNSKLRTILAVEKKKQQQNQRRLFLLRAYWVAAAAASLTVLTQVPWPDASSAPIMYVLGSVLAPMLIIPILLLMSQRSNLLGFISCVLTGELKDTDEGLHT